MTRNKDSSNLLVIGGGSAGLVSAYIAAAVKAKVVLIEQHKMGGDCLNTGCVPSKALIKTARVMHQIRQHKAYGIRHATAEVDLADVMQRVQGIIKQIEPHDSVERYRSLGVECIQGHAEILDPQHVRVNGQVLRSKAIILALGASPVVPSIKGLAPHEILTSESLWNLKVLPRRLVVLGGGAIGCEMAQAFQRLGSQVTLIEAAPRLLLKEDEDVSRMVAENFAKEGLDVRLQSKVLASEERSGERVLICEAADGRRSEVPFDALFAAVGRRANTQNVDWQKLGIELNANGTIKVDAYLRANGKQIYACGDVAGPYQFTHAASHQAWYCAVNALFSPFKKFKVDYRVLPWVTFTDPEIAQVGLNEQMAREQGIPYHVTTYGIDDLDRAIAESEAHGRVKVLTVPGKDQILGANIVGPHAGELLGTFTSAMKHRHGLNSILGTIHPYPTFGEANRYAAGQWKREHAPQKILNILRLLHTWRR